MMNTNDSFSDFFKSLIVQVIATQKELDSRDNEDNSAPPPSNDSSSVETLNVREVAKLLDCCVGSVWNYCKKGKLKNYKIGKKVFFIKKEVLEALKINQDA